MDLAKILMDRIARNKWPIRRLAKRYSKSATNQRKIRSLAVSFSIQLLQIARKNVPTDKRLAKKALKALKLVEPHRAGSERKLKLYEDIVRNLGELENVRSIVEAFSTLSEIFEAMSLLPHIEEHQTQEAACTLKAAHALLQGNDYYFPDEGCEDEDVLQMLKQLEEEMVRKRAQEMWAARPSTSQLIHKRKTSSEMVNIDPADQPSCSKKFHN